MTTRAASAVSACRAASRWPRPSRTCRSTRTRSTRPPICWRRSRARRSRSAAAARSPAASSRWRRRPSPWHDGKATTKRTRVTLLTERGLQQFILEDAENLQFADPALRDKVGQALLAIQTNRAKEARTLELATRGQGRRTVRVAYIVEVPVWKASYRLTLAADPAARALGAAGLGDDREFERPGLEGHRADPGLGPSGGLPPGALRSLLRQAAGGPGRSRRAG